MIFIQHYNLRMKYSQHSPLVSHIQMLDLYCLAVRKNMVGHFMTQDKKLKCLSAYSSILGYECPNKMRHSVIRRKRICNVILFLYVVEKFTFIGRYD